MDILIERTSLQSAAQQHGEFSLEQHHLLQAVVVKLKPALTMIAFLLGAWCCSLAKWWLRQLGKAGSMELRIRKPACNFPPREAAATGVMDLDSAWNVPMNSQES